MNDVKLMSTIGLCKKAGKLIMGFDAVARAMERGEVSLLALAEDLSPKSEKEIIRLAIRHNIESVRLPAAMEQIKRLVGKKAGILAVTDEGLAKSVLAKTQARQDEEE